MPLLMSCKLHEEPIKSFAFLDIYFVSLFLLLLYLKANYVIICFVAQQTKLNMTASSSIAYLQLWQGGHPCLHTFCSLAAETCLEMLKVSRTKKTQFKIIHIMCHHTSWSQSNFFLFPASWSWLMIKLPSSSVTDRLVNNIGETRSSPKKRSTIPKMLLAQTNGSHFCSSVAEIFNFLTFSRELLVPLVHCCPRQIHKGTIKMEAIKVPRQVMSWERLSSCAMSSMREKQHWGKEGATEPEPPQPICLRCNFREAGTKYSCIFFTRPQPRRKELYI